MIVASWNINSVRIRLELIKNWIIDRNPDVILFQEIKCENTEFPEDFFKELGFVCKVHGQKGRNGVAIVIKKYLENNITDVIVEDFNKTNESRFIGINLDKFDLTICSLYTPNGNPINNSIKFQNKLLWYKNLRVFTNFFFKNERNIILGGDFNVLENSLDVNDIQNWRNDALGHRSVVKTFRELLALGLTNVVRVFKKPGESYSFWDYQKQSWERNYGLLIDHFLVSPKILEKIKNFGIDSRLRSFTKPSDHAPIWIKIN